MWYELLITDEAREQLRALPKRLRRNIGRRLDLLQDNLAGDVKKLSGREGKYRLRVGSHRVLFELKEHYII
jgi:mRNA interferase RelE/StbE